MEGLCSLAVGLLLLAAFLAFHFKLSPRKTREKHKNRNYPPSPCDPLPIVGHLHLFAKYAHNHWQAFDSFREKCGNVVSLKLGDKKCVLISSLSAMKEVLITKGDIFCNRPDFSRYLLIFGGDRENSLALCDWSELQRFRRQIAQNAIIPRFGSQLHTRLQTCTLIDVREMIENALNKQSALLTKVDLLSMCFNVFANYLCSQRFSTNDETFREQAKGFDYVFYDINQCYTTDFIAVLNKVGFARSNWKQLKATCDGLRDFVEDYLVKTRLERKANGSIGDEQRDFLDTLLDHHFNNPDVFNWKTFMFEIGDLLGGHSAVGNLLMRLIGHLAVNPKCQECVFDEAKLALHSKRDTFVGINHRPKMPFTEASIMETLRIASSPIVPHIPVEDTKLQDFDIEKDTMILFNSYHLNTSSLYWEEPKEFNPKRFLVPDENDKKQCRINKPENYFPFSFGKRSCLGYKMVSTITFIVIANLLLNFEISCSFENQLKIEKQLEAKGRLALPCDDCFEVILTPRN